MEDNIREIAKIMTREEFVKVFSDGGNCPSYYGLYEPEKCNHIVECEQCIRESIKVIKFKGEEETIEAICIDSGTGLALTKNKKYSVKESKYTNFYDLINDKGEEDSYFKSRFRILEGEKMEEKKIMVRCIEKCKEDPKALIINKEYPVLEESKDCYLILNDKDSDDTWYSKKLFEKVEDVLMVECMDNNSAKDRLTIGKKYKVIEQDEKYYTINDNIARNQSWGIGRFKPVEPQNEVKEENICYNEKCDYNNKNGVCESKIAESFKCNNRDVKQPTSINYEEEYNKLKKENEKLNIIVSGKQEVERENEKLKNLLFEKGTENSKPRNKIEDLENTIKEKEDHIRNLNIIIDRKNKELEDLKETFNKKQNQWKNEQVERVNEIEEENRELKRLHENQRLNIKSEMSENRELKAAIQKGIESVKECGEALKDKNKKIEALKESVIKLTELL